MRPAKPLPRLFREEREAARVRRVAAAAAAAGASAMEVALAQIRAAFGEAATINTFKVRVERMVALGPHHPAVRARFAARAAGWCGCSLDTAIAKAERWWRDERKAFQIASALGCATRLSLDVLRELSLVLRLMRFKRMEAEFCAIATALSDRDLDRNLATAAE